MPGATVPQVCGPLARATRLAARHSRGLNQLTRQTDWRGKINDLALFTGFALALQRHPGAELLVTCFLFLAASAALAVFGYAWNDVCDADADRRAGKERPPRSESRSISIAALTVAVVCFAAAARLDPALMGIALGALLAAWAYSARPLRLKERGGLGLVAGAAAQRALPAAFVVAASDLSVLHALPWLVWMMCWGLRAMVIHQAEDAEHDRRAGLATWGAGRNSTDFRRLIAVLVPVEAATLGIALLPVIESPSPMIAAIALLGVWIVCHAAALRRLRARSLRVDWLSSRYMPLEELSGVVAPTLVAIALIHSGTWVGAAWVALDATLRAPALWEAGKRLLRVARPVRSPRAARSSAAPAA